MLVILLRCLLGLEIIHKGALEVFLHKDDLDSISVAKNLTNSNKYTLTA
jgi:hypothetical protein